MAKTKKELLASAPWRGKEETEDKFKDAKLKATRNQAGSTMHLHRKKNNNTTQDTYEDDSITEIDPQLRYSFQRNYQFLRSVFSIDTIVKPLPPAMAYNVSRNLSFFTRIFTQFFGKIYYIYITLFIIELPIYQL